MQKTTFLLALLSLVLAQAASAHVEARPAKITAGSVARVTFEVPAEEEVPAVKFSVQLPVGASEVTLQPTAGWKNALKGRIAAWSGGQIAPGKAAEFSLIARWPATPGTTLVFPAVETYANGKVVFWIGPESSETPAARVELTAAKTPAPPPPVVTTSTSNDEDSSGATKWLIGVGIVVALAAIGLAFLWRRRR